MNQLRIIGLTVFSVLSFNAYAENTYNYRQEFESFRQSSVFTELVEAFVDTITKALPENLDATQRSSLFSSLVDIDFVFSCPESLPTFNAFLERTCNLYQIEEPLVIIVNRTTPYGDSLAQQFESNGVALVMAKDFLLSAPDQEIETFIKNELEKLQHLLAEASHANASQTAL